MSYQWVFTKDWHGVQNQFRIIRLVYRENGLYSCTFVNSEGDIERKLVKEQDLFE